MKFLSDNNIENTTVILRCDFNVPIKDGKINDDSKIIKSLDTIKYLLAKGNKVIILSHFGRVKTEDDKINNSLKIVCEELKKYINVVFIENNENIEFYLNNSKSMCFLVENTRFTDIPEKRESSNNLDLAEYWSKYATLFVIDAFISMHREHSSTAGISKFLPTYIGLLAEKEIKNLEKLVHNNDHPFVVVMGGAKVDDKIKIINGMLNKCDKLVLTGGILNSFLKVMGKNIGKSLVSEDEEVLNNVKNILNNNKDKIYYSDRFTVDRNGEILEINSNEILDNDIIYDNIFDLDYIINEAKVVFFNGTCGKYEDDKYKKGTLTLLEMLNNSDASVYIGGGDTVSAVKTLGFEKVFTYLSSGGGATLEYVSDGKLKALEYIKENSVNN